MADTVEYHMERMLPELDDLEKRGLFSKEEIKQIVKKRRDFEYLLKRPSPLKQDFLSYIVYETNLESLRQLRKKALIRDMKGAPGDRWKPSLCDHASCAHILMIYQRAVTRFKGDMKLWLQYLEYCKREASKKFQKVATKCLQLHPNVPGLWMYAAAWEFEHNVNMKAARVLMQRGLRMCPRAENLWIEYFRLELTYMQKLKARRRVLRLGPVSSNQKKLEEKTEGGDDVVMRDREDESDGEEEKSDVDEEGQVEAEVCLEDQMSFKLSEAIFSNAVAALPTSLEFRQHFLDVLDKFNFEQKEDLEEKIHASIAHDFPRNEKSWDWLARRHVESQKVGCDYTFLEGKRRAVQVFEDGLESSPSVHMYELYARFLLDLLDLEVADLDGALQSDSTTGDKTIRHGIAEDLLKLYERAAAVDMVSEELVKGHLEVLLRSGRVDEASQLGRSFCERLETKKYASVWEWRISLEMGRIPSASSTDDEAIVSKLIQQALSRVTLADARRLYLMAMEFYTGNESHFDVVINSLSSAMGGGNGGQVGAEIACTAVEWVLQSQGIKQARRVYKRFLALPGPSVELFKHCIRMESRFLGTCSEAQESQKNLQKLFFDAVELFGQNDTELWLMYYSQEMKAGNVEAAKNVHWRAKKSLKDSTKFIETLQML